MEIVMNKLLMTTAALMMIYGTMSVAEQPIRVTEPQRPGPAGPAGRDGVDGSMASIWSLQTRTPTKGQWTGSLGISGDDGGATGAAVGARYGVTDNSDVYIVIGTSDDEMSWGAGVTFTLN